MNKPDKNSDSISVPKKVMLGVAPAAAIIGILLSTDRSPQALLFLIGIALGVVIGLAIANSAK